MNKTILSIILAVTAIGAGMHFMNAMTANGSRFLSKDFLMEANWAKFKIEHGRFYATSSEETFRKAVFAKAHAFVTEHNSVPRSYTVGINKFADMTAEEFKAQNLRPHHFTSKLAAPRARSATKVAAHATKDWRTEGKVNDVKDQGQCGSCWAFGAVAAAESAYAISNNELLSFSEQALVDCVTADYGCNGGLQEDAYDYLMNHFFIAENDYPYTAETGSCHYSTSNKTNLKVSAYNRVTANDADATMRALDNGPVTVSIEADQMVFQFYTSGIFDSSSCGTQLDHAVALVGYDNGQGYFILRNSWGTSWGEEGYMRISSGGSGAGYCGVLSEPIEVSVA